MGSAVYAVICLLWTVIGIRTMGKEEISLWDYTSVLLTLIASLGCNIINSAVQ